MNRIALLLTAACIGLAGWAVWERNGRLSLESEMAEMTAAGTLPGLSPGEKASRRRATGSGEAPADGETAAAGEAAKKPEAKSSGSMGESIAKMMSDPGMRQAQARMNTTFLYRDLFDLLNLEEPKRSQLEALITERAASGMEIGFSAIGPDKTAEDKKAASEQIKANGAEMNAKIKELVGEDAFGQMERYEKSMYERMQLDQFNNLLGGKNLKLDESTETKLMDAMYQEREKYPFASSYADQMNPDLTRFSQENLDRFNNEYAEMNTRIAGRAEKILPPDQLELFKQSQQTHSKMAEIQMQMITEMFGGAAK